MTTITLSYHSDEEVQSYFDQLSQEEKEAAVVVDDYDLPQNWDKWEKIQSEFKKNRFLFFRKIDPEDPKFATLYFVDLVKIALLLEEHYDVFKKETGLDFHPLQAGLEIESGSVFWDKVFDNSALVGLLYGFGVKNSFSFKWKYGECAEINKRFCQSLHSHFSDEPAYGKTNIAHFRLPIFASFSEEDEMIEKYKKERDEIKRRYQKKDFLITTLQKLASQ